MEKAHRRFAESVELFQPLAAYEGVGDDSQFRIEWPANLTVIYQSSFYQDYNLVRAWQDVPGSVIRGLIDTIRTRVLRLALELKDDLGLVGDDISELRKETVDRSVVTYIFGGNNVIASRDFTQMGSVHIDTGDWSSLSEALHMKLGMDASAISELKLALDHDATAATNTQGLGKRTAEWLKQVGKKSAGVAVNIGLEVVKKEVTGWILQYLGQHSH